MNAKLFFVIGFTLQFTMQVAADMPELNLSDAFDGDNAVRK